MKLKPIENKMAVHVNTEEEEHMSVEEVLQWLIDHYSDGTYMDLFGMELPIYTVIRTVGAGDVVKKIEEYESKRNKEEQKKREIEIEWVYYIYDPSTDKSYEFTTKDEAMRKCEEIVKENGVDSIEYTRFCKRKENKE